MLHNASSIIVLLASLDSPPFRASNGPLGSLGEAQSPCLLGWAEERPVFIDDLHPIDPSHLRRVRDANGHLCRCDVDVCPQAVWCEAHDVPVDQMSLVSSC